VPSPRYGLVAFASSLDQIGILAKTPEDVLLTSFVLFGKDHLDSTTTDVFMDFSPKASEVRRIGLVKEIDISAVDPQVKEGYELFVKQLSKDFDVVEVSIPHWEELLLLLLHCTC